MTREESIDRIAKIINAHCWYENTLFAECVKMAEHQAQGLEKLHQANNRYAKEVAQCS